MKRVLKNEIVAECPMDKFFAYATTMRHWPEWHPVTLSVTGQVAKPAKTGDRAHEKVRTARFFSGTIDWKIVKSIPPVEFSMQALKINLPLLGGARVKIDYRFEPLGKKKTRMTRIFQYQLPFYLVVLDTLYLIWQNEKRIGGGHEKT
ncbi:MAG: SRPBCC family protein [Deltaproteobacteria bacterium]|nr:SRPBCC family protein [Deltaproteobacteria bacterium]